MRKFYRLISVFFLTALLGLGLVACGEKEEFKVEFMVQNEANTWVTLQDKKVEEGKVELVEAPAKTYYTFTGWFNEEALTTPFENKEIKSNLKVYAKYTPVEVKVVINGDEPLTKNLVDVVNATYNPGEGLQFNGWYIDTALQVKWNGKDIVETLYANSIALVTYNDGYKNVHTEIVKPGEVLANPATAKVTIEEKETTVEKANILQDYMSEYDIAYVDAEGQSIDFSKPITKSKTITVLWNTKGLSSYAQKIQPSKEGNYYLNITSFSEVAEAPVISFRDTLTKVETKIVDGEEVETKSVVKMTFVRLYAECLPDSVRKIIFGEGIKAIQGFNGAAASSVEEIQLPSTLKILDNSFNNMTKLNGITLPLGLEVLIGSFFVDSLAHNSNHTLGNANKNYEIIVPKTVKNIAMMPNNLKFSHTKETASIGDFYKGEDGRIYLNDERGLILVSDPAAFDGFYTIELVGQKVPKTGTVVVPDGVKGIQVGTYMSAFDYLKLPKSFEFVNYNANISDYVEFYDVFHNVDDKGVMISKSGNVLFDKEQFDAADKTQASVDFVSMETEAVAITKNVSGFDMYGLVHCGSGVVVFDHTKAELPKGLELAFCLDKLDLIPLHQLEKYVSYKDDKNSVFVAVQFNGPHPMAPDDSSLALPTNVCIRLEDKTTLDEASVKEALIAANTNLEKIFTSNDVEFYENDKKITLGEVKTDMYITIKLIEKKAA